MKPVATSFDSELAAEAIGAEQARARAALQSLVLPRFASRDPARPWVVAFEGPNGAGKTTLCRSLVHQLGAPCCLGTDAAWFSPAFKERMIRDAEWYASAMFFLSGCCEQMRVLRGRPARFVLMDRSLWSTLAVHAGEDPERLEQLLAMLQPVAAQIQVPDLTLVLTASFETCQARIANKRGTARALDALTATIPFHTREQEFYRWLARQTPTVVLQEVDQHTADEVAEIVSKLLSERLPAC
jgi:thymidylate kinase